VKFVVISLAAALVSLCGAAHCAQTPPNKAVASKEIEHITDHIYRIGKVMVNTEARTITCTGAVNMDSGAIEYFAVAPGGKLHESLLRIDVRPLHLQLALLLLNLEPQNTLKYQGDPAVPHGAPVHISVAWRDARGAERKAAAEELMMEMPGEKPDPPHDWVFTGSRILKDVGFEPDTGRSLVAVWHDPAAILDNPAPAGARNAYAVGPKCPRRGTHVEMTITAAAVSTREKAPVPASKGR
jgi:hypothetical protein